MNKQPKIFGIFLWKDGSWSLWGTFTNRSSADQELDWLVNSLGVQAKLFVKQN